MSCACACNILVSIVKRHKASSSFSSSNGSTALRGPRPPQFSRLHDHTQTHHTRYDSSGRVIGQSQKPLPDNTQHSQETDIHAPGGIRTHNPSKRAAADPLISITSANKVVVFCSVDYYVILCYNVIIEIV
jgi:hypothetical protein